MKDTTRIVALAAGITALSVVGGVGAYLVTGSLDGSEKPVSASPSPSETPSDKPQPSPSEAVTEEPEPCEVSIADFDGLSTTVGPWNVHVNEAYIDADGYITDGMGYGITAPSGSDYHIWNIQITNTGQTPAEFSTGGTTGMDHDGRTHVNDWEAEWAVADDYFEYDTLNPGGSVETDVIFLMEEDVSLTEVTVSGVGRLAPCEK